MKRCMAMMLALLMIIALTPAFGEEEEMTTIRVLASTRSPYNPEETSIWDELARRTGVKIEWTWAPSSNYNEKVNTILASGNIPDAIYGIGSALLISQGAIIPLDEYLEKWCPNYLALLKEEDKLFLRNPEDGQMYFMSHILDFPPSMSNLIRADWVEAAGMDMPETWDEWMAYWEYVRDNDVNGNGDPADEIPLTIPGAAQLLDLCCWFDMRVLNSYFAQTDDGKMVPIYEHPNFETFLRTMIELYENGILDREFVTRHDTFLSMLDSDRAGSTYYFAERANLTTLTLRDSGVENGALVGIIPPAYFEGADRHIVARDRVYPNGLALTIAAEKNGTIEAIMKLWNYIYSEEGSQLLNYGIEGRHHTRVGDEFVYTEEVLSGGFTSARRSGVIPSVMNYNMLPEAYMQILTGGRDYEELSEPMRLFYDALYLNEPYFHTAAPLLETELYIEYGADYTPKLTSIFARCVVGELTVEQFFEEYEKIKTDGWQEIIDEQIAAYEMMTA